MDYTQNIAKFLTILKLHHIHFINQTHKDFQSTEYLIISEIFFFFFFTSLFILSHKYIA